MRRTLTRLLILTCVVVLTHAKPKKECKDPDIIVAIDFPKEVDDCLTDKEEKDLRGGEKTWNEVWKALVERCPDVKKHDNGAALFALTIFPKGLKVTGKQDMADQLVDYAKKNKCCIKKLRISGHGSSGQFSVGDGQKRIKCKYVNGNQKEWKKAFKKLKKVMCKDPTILIDACSTGAGEAGEKKMKELAKYFDATVVAPTGTCDGVPVVEDLPANMTRTVKPPVKKPKKIEVPPTEEDGLNEEAANDLRNKMKETEEQPLKGELESFGVFKPTDENIPNLTGMPELPHNQEIWQGLDIRPIPDGTAFIAFTDTVPYQFESSSVIIIEYFDNTFDNTYDVIHGILGDRLLMTTDDEGFMVIYSLSDSAREMLQFLKESSHSG